MKRFYKNILSIRDNELASTPWEHITDKLETACIDNKIQLKLGNKWGKQSLDNEDSTVGLESTHEVTCRITRRDDFLISLISDGILDINLTMKPSLYWKSSHCIHKRNCISRCCAVSFDTIPVEYTDYSKPSKYPSGIPVLPNYKNTDYILHPTNIMISYIRFVFLNQLYKSDLQTINHTFIENTASIKRCFRCLGCLHLLALPFTLTFATVFWILSLVEEGRRSSNYLGARQWSPYAKLLFREYSELPHEINKRCISAIPKAKEYLQKFPSPLLDLIGRSVAFISGSLLLVIIVISFLFDEESLIDVQLGGKSIVWYVAILSSTVAFGRAIIPTVDDTGISLSEAFQHMSDITHFYPTEWRGREFTTYVRKNIEHLFPNRAFLLVQEIIFILIAPWVLFIIFPKRTDIIISKLKKRIVFVPGLGDVCIHSLLGQIQLEKNTINETQYNEYKISQSISSFHQRNPIWSNHV